jgi:CubicO group peptidase (beta-lactamase class C family)
MMIVHYLIDIRRRVRFGIAMLSLWTAVAFGTPPEKALRIDTLMHRLAERGQFNGAVLVSDHGKVIYHAGFGTANIKENIPFTTSTPCYLASLSKQFTAMAIMILHDRHKLSYSDRLSAYFPELPPYARSVTVRHLLNHTSGIPDYVGLGLEHPGLTNKEVFRTLARIDSLEFTPGEKFSYSNSGYILLAMIIEKVSGQSYRTFLKNNIFDPLGMSNTAVYDESAPAINGKARGYGRFADDDDYNLLTVGEGGIYSSVDDLFKWDQALYTEQLVSHATLDEALAPARLSDGSSSNYGFGWGIGTYNGEPAVSHAGREGGFNTYIKRLPAEHTAVIFLTNHGFRNMGAIGNPLLSILHDQSYSLPKLSLGEMLYAKFRLSGIDSTLEEYRSLKRMNDTSYDYSESELNELGYELLGTGRVHEAIDILKLNVEAFPRSGNVYDGLGEAYMKNGDRELAIQNYKKELELDPGNSNARSMLGKLGVN